MEGSTTAKTAYYTDSMCEAIISSLCPQHVQSTVPAMICMPVTPQKQHREKHVPTTDFIDVPSLMPEGIMFDADSLAPNVAAMVTRLLSRKEMLDNPKAIQAVRKEAEGLQSVDTWDLRSVKEKDEVAIDVEAETEVGVEVEVDVDVEVNV